MKLFNLDNSPFAARVRMQIFHKRLPVDICALPYKLRTPEFKAEYPLGKVPALRLDDGQYIVESVAIMNYLEALFPHQPMIPDEPLARAHNDMLVAYTDCHLSLGLAPLFKEFLSLSHAKQSPESRSGRFDALTLELEKLERLLGDVTNVDQRSLQTGDLCLITSLCYVTILADYFNQANVLAGLSRVNQWHQWVMEFPAVSDQIKVISDAHHAMASALMNNSKQEDKVA